MQDLTKDLCLISDLSPSSFSAYTHTSHIHSIALLIGIYDHVQWSPCWNWATRAMLSEQTLRGERGSRLAGIMVFFMEPEFKQWFSSKTVLATCSHTQLISSMFQCEPHTRTIKGKQRTSSNGHWADHLCPALRMFNVHYKNFNWTIVVISRLKLDNYAVVTMQSMMLKLGNISVCTG